MTHYPAPIIQVIKQFSKLPGIGEKTAERLAMHLLKAPNEDARGLAQSIVELKEKIKLCSKCYSLSDADVCHICNNPRREAALLCVVEQPADMVSIEKSGGFKGLYFILGGALSPMDGVGPDDIRIHELMRRVENTDIKEVVIATGTNVEGEATASYIAGLLAGKPLKTTRIASGVPIGGDLKYVDQMTLRRAMEIRYDFR